MSWRHLCRRGSIEKYTPTDGCPGCTRILLGQSTVLPHTEPGLKNEAPEKDVTADDAAGAPADKAVQASEERRDEGILPYPDNLEERSSLKRAPAEPSSSSTPAGSKAKAAPVKPQKRPGELRIAAGPKLKSSHTKKKRENLRYQLKI